MDKQDKLEAYFDTESPWKSGIIRLRQLISTTELVEDWKWNFPTYTLHNKNVVAIASHKTHFGIWFFQGVFLNDPHNLLRNAQEGKTKAMRSFYFTSLEDINDDTILTYVLEAIQNSKDGKQVKATRKKIDIVIPKILENAFENSTELKHSFYKLTPGKQREYAEHIGGAKQETTRLRRLDKCIPMIIEGAGLHDTYKNC